MIEWTLVILKPDVIAANAIGGVLAIFEDEDLTIVEMEMIKLTQHAVDEFYREHVIKDWYLNHARFMTSGPCVAVVLGGDDAVARVRKLVGNTDPKKASPHSLRGIFGKNMPENAVHASDSLESAKREIAFFFSEL